MGCRFELCQKYKGTCTEPGYRWISPFYTSFPFDLKVHNFETPKVTVNDVNGTPIIIEAIVVWQIRDAAASFYEVQDVQTFIKTSAESALRDLAGSYPYEAFEEGQISLRQSSAVIQEKLTEQIQKVVDKVGVSILEARISELSYCSSIAVHMLRRQQADSVLGARQLIVQGAVSMVETALRELSKTTEVNWDPDLKAQMVSNMVVVLVGDERTQPVMVM